MKLFDIIFESVVDLNEIKRANKDGTYWDPESAKEIISKYKSLNDFVNDYPRLYGHIHRKGLIPQMLGNLERGVSYKTGEPVSIIGNVKYSKDDIRNIASKYKYIEDFIKNEGGAYPAAKRLGIFDEVTKNMLVRKVRYTDKDYEDTAKKYEGRTLMDFIKNETGIYHSLMARKSKEYIEDLLKNMVRKKSTLTNDELRNIAKKYNTRKEFRAKEPEAYGIAYARGPFIKDPLTGKSKNSYEFYHDITSHMDRLGNRFKRMVYVHEFRDQNGTPVAVYVGLTRNEEIRKSQHLNLRDITFSSIKEFVKQNPNLVHTYFAVSDGYIDANDAVNMECDYEKKYRNDKRWVVLNRSKCGGLGGGVKYDEKTAREIASKYNDYSEFITKEIKLYDALSRRNIPLRDEITRHMKKNRNYYTDDDIRNIALKYDTLGDFRRDYPSVVSQAMTRGIYNDITKNMERKTAIYTNDDLINIAVKAGSFSNFRKNYPKPYQVAIKKRKLKPEILAAIEKSKLSNNVNESKLSLINTLYETN